MTVSERRERLTPRPPKFKLVSASEIAMEKVEWAWASRVPLRGVTLVPGREGLGKSTLCYELAARLSRGQLEGDLYGEPCQVVCIGHEDSIASMVKPRLIAAGADLDQVKFLRPSDPERPAAFEVPGDVAELTRTLDSLPNPRLIIVDPLDAHLTVDTHKKAETQAAIGTLTRMADDRKLAVLGVAHHSKAPTLDALDRVTGSKAFVTAVRSVLTVAPHPEEDRVRVLAVNKSNYACMEDVPVLKFKIEPEIVSEGELEMSCGRIAWLGEATDVEARYVLQPPEDPEAKEGAEFAAEWLTEILRNGPVGSRDVKRWAADADISVRTLQRARKKLGAVVSADEHTRGKPTTWSLPGFGATEAGTKPVARNPIPSPTSANDPPEGGLVPPHQVGTKPTSAPSLASAIALAERELAAVRRAPLLEAVDPRA